MLFWNVKQSTNGDGTMAPSCDLMLFWNVKQFYAEFISRFGKL